MALLTVQHTVRDYRAWRAVYDTLDEVQRDWGVTDASVHQLAGAPNTVLVLLRFATVAQAQGFLTNGAIPLWIQPVTRPGTLTLFAGLMKMAVTRSETSAP